MLNAATCINGEKGAPEAGDLTVCAYCASFLKWTSPDILELLTAEEIGNLDASARAALTKARTFINEQRLDS